MLSSCVAPAKASLAIVAVLPQLTVTDVRDKQLENAAPCTLMTEAGMAIDVIGVLSNTPIPIDAN
jgi:hypothetical protein